MVVGLTGGIGSGKSTVAADFARHGIRVIDADAIAHAMTAAGGAAIAPIRAAFGDAFINAQGAMDRDRMRAHVFGKADERTRLESILHPLIRAETARQMALADSAYVILMIPLLVEAAARDPEHWRDRYDRIVVADCAEETQIRRVMARNGFTSEAVRAIMAAQASRADRLAHADDVIDNDGALSTMRTAVDALHAKYLVQAQARASAR
jgi:dephospho-CoA kinase